MHRRFVVAAFVICAALGVLIYSAVLNTAKAVVTVEELAASKEPYKNIRLGARVTEESISYQTNPSFLVSFTVRGVGTPASGANSAGQAKIQVEYPGIKPDTLQAGRDVILEGDFAEGKFKARTLLTQCPSKYVPPSEYKAENS